MKPAARMAPRLQALRLIGVSCVDDLRTGRYATEGNE
jgi:hypothetical protein